MHVRSGAFNRVDQARCGINSKGAAHSKDPLLALGQRVHFGIPLLALVLVELGPLMIVASRIVPSHGLRPTSSTASHHYHSLSGSYPRGSARRSGALPADGGSEPLLQEMNAEHHLQRNRRTTSSAGQLVKHGPGDASSFWRRSTRSP